MCITLTAAHIHTQRCMHALCGEVKFKSDWNFAAPTNKFEFDDKMVLHSWPKPGCPGNYVCAPYALSPLPAPPLSLTTCIYKHKIINMFSMSNPEIDIFGWSESSLQTLSLLRFPAALLLRKDGCATFIMYELAGYSIVFAESCPFAPSSVRPPRNNVIDRL